MKMFVDSVVGLLLVHVMVCFCLLLALRIARHVGLEQFWSAVVSWRECWMGFRWDEEVSALQVMPIPFLGWRVHLVLSKNFLDELIDVTADALLQIEEKGTSEPVWLEHRSILSPSFSKPPLCRVQGLRIKRLPNGRSCVGFQALSPEGEVQFLDAGPYHNCTFRSKGGQVVDVMRGKDCLESGAPGAAEGPVYVLSINRHVYRPCEAAEVKEVEVFQPSNPAYPPRVYLRLLYSDGATDKLPLIDPGNELVFQDIQGVEVGRLRFRPERVETGR